MKYSKLAYLVSIIISILIIGCNAECENISEDEAIILFDVSDTNLYKGIRKDFMSDFPVFAEQEGLDMISSCEKLTYRLAPMGGQSELRFSSAHIEITQTGMGISNNEEDEKADPRPLEDLLKSKMEDYSKLSQRSDITSGSNIANIFLKAINSSNIDAENSTVIIYSDLIENTRYLNMYQSVPSESEMDNITDELFDPIVLNNFEKKREAGLSPQLIVVSKPSDNAAVDLRKVRNFWRIIFEKKLGLQVQFVDNLTQYELMR